MTEMTLTEAIRQLQTSKVFAQLFEFTDKSTYFKEQIDNLNNFIFTSQHLTSWIPSIKKYADFLRSSSLLEELTTLNIFTGNLTYAITLLRKAEAHHKDAVETVYNSIYDSLDQLQ